MLATLVSMSPGGQMPLGHQANDQGVTIRLGDRVQFFVELPHWCLLDHGDDGAESPEHGGALRTVLESIDAPAPQHAAFEVEAADPEQPDASAVLEPELALDSQAAAEPEPQATVSVTADEDDDSDEPGAWVDPEEAVTLKQIAEADRSDEDATADSDTGERDPEAAPQPASASASTNDLASAEDGAPAEDERPADVEPVQAPDTAGQGANAAPGDAGLETGRDLVSADGRAWVDRFARVRQEVRDAFRPLRP
jgi:hypothetical protein